MSNKNINDIIIFMINNNLDYKNYDLLSNLNVFINKDYISNKKLTNLVRTFENNLIYPNFNMDSSVLEALEMMRNRATLPEFEYEEENDEYFDDENYEEEEVTESISMI